MTTAPTGSAPAVVDAEVVTVLDAEQAVKLDKRIRLMSQSVADSYTRLVDLIAEAKRGEIHQALGFPSWTAYVADACAELQTASDAASRRGLVAIMADEGMSQRAIAEVIGVDQKTVSRDLNAGEANASPEPDRSVADRILDVLCDAADNTETYSAAADTRNTPRRQHLKPVAKPGVTGACTPLTNDSAMNTSFDNRPNTAPVIAPGVPLAVAAEIAAYLDIDTAAAAVDVTRQTMKEWIRDGLVPTYRLGHKFIRIKASDLLALYKPVPPQPEPAKRGPGRPRKNPLPAVAVMSTGGQVDPRDGAA